MLCELNMNYCHDDPRYKLAVKECEVAILHSPTIPTIYIVPAIAGTINQLRSTSRPPNQPPTNTTTNRTLIYATNNWEGYNATEYVLIADIEETNKEPPFIRYFRQGGGRSTFGRGERGNKGMTKGR